MCGIFGSIGPTDLDERRAGALRALRAIEHRGPDGEGVAVDSAAGVLLAHKRLAIIDPEHGKQPMDTADGRLTIVFNGPRLSQSDLDVWEHCLHLARINGTGCHIRFTAYSFLKAIGRNTGKSDREWLKGVLLDLASSVVEINDSKRAYFGPLIHHGIRDDETGEYVIEVNPRVALLYGADGWTQIEWAQRQALRRQPLAQWLHGFYSTHTEPYPYKVDTLRRLAGSENEHLFSFRQELRAAMSKMAEVTGWAWRIAEADLVHVAKQTGQKPVVDNSENVRG